MSSEVRQIVQNVQLDHADRRMREVRMHSLPPEIVDLIEEYERFEDARETFIWRWVHRLAPNFTLPSVNPEYIDRVVSDKVIATLFITLLDDVLEDRKDRETFEEAAKVPFDHQTIEWDREDIDHNYIAFTERVWETLSNRIFDAPEFHRYNRILLYDLKQAINAIDYTSLVIDDLNMATLDELSRYESHNMMMFVYADLDLMHSPPLPDEDLPILRTALWSAQVMARIGNWLSTWERELREGDYSSGVIVYALRNGILTPADLQRMEDDPTNGTFSQVVHRINQHKVEETILDLWDDRYNELHVINSELSSIDLTPYVHGMKEVLRFHLSSKGLK